MNDAVAMVLVTLIVVALSLAGLALVRRTVPASRLEANTDVAGYVYAVVGVIYAVILAFIVIAVWEDYRDAEAAASSATLMVCQS